MAKKQKTPVTPLKTTLMAVPISIRKEVERLIDDETEARKRMGKPLNRKAYALDKKVVAEITKHIKIVQRLSGKLEKQGNKLSDIDYTLSRKDDDWVGDELDKLQAIQEQIEEAHIDV